MEEQAERPKLIGLTGGIGSGKTTVARIIEDNGFPVYFSDIRAKNLVNENEFLREEIKGFLGEKAYDENGKYDTKYVSAKVFADSQLLEKLNNAIHPAVKLDFENWRSLQTAPMIFKETALLFELGIDKECDASLLVTAEDNMRIKRVMDRDGKTYREVENILEKQMPEKDKIKKADYVIYNNMTLENLQEATEEVLNKILKEMVS
ncbi:dephospho-CoA kinase [Halpernia humi]|uniref:Dephospho-CoA kinase n=1 Tax=Halpernia humi TaxID=493375 RepID=A0A1H5WJ92_9FLAO|nr:dephospho-CoA kinase [Halpernia humi]SEF99413.1 dephospho-CoA kinase [Halpernia humi]